MDPTSVISMLTSVYQAVSFIQQVAEGMSKAADEQSNFEVRLTNAAMFLKEFQTMMFSEKNPVGLIQSADLDAAFKNHVETTIRRLAKDMSEYRDAMKPYKVEDSGHKSGKSHGLKDQEQKHRWISEVKRSSSWALFGKDSLLKALEKIEDWTERLRQILALAMQKDKWLKEQIMSSKFEQGDSAKRLGVSLVAKRQRLLAESPKTVYRALDRGFLYFGNHKRMGNLHICRYIETDEDGTRTDDVVVIEYKNFHPPFPADKRRIKSLVTTLMDSDFADQAADMSQRRSDKPDILLNVLPCMGYIDEPEHRRAGIVYKLPEGVTEDSCLTLYQMLVQSNRRQVVNEDEYNATLGDKFFLAYNFASAVANLHACGLVHKSICSKALLLIPPEPGRLSTDKTRAVPYLIGFGYARPAVARTLLVPADNTADDFYRHPHRQGERVLSFTKEYDIYAVGVVLLEIGVWRPLGDYRRISSAMTSSGETLRKQLISVATTELEPAMGKRYTQAVLACLKTDFDVRDDDEARSKLALAFREKVLSALEAGIDL